MEQEIQPQLSAPKSKKGLKIFLAVLVVVLVGAIGYIALFLIPNISKNEVRDIGPHPGQELPEFNVFNWQTYRNEEFGFEFEYPKNWGVIQLSDSKAGVVLKSPNYSPISSGEVVFSGEIYLNTTPNPKNLSVIDFVRTFDDTSRFWPDNFNYTAFFMNNREVVRFSNIQESKNFLQEVVFIKFDKQIISISYIFNQEKDSEVSKILDKVVSTFKSTNSRNASDWQTYRNEEFGFEIQHLSSFSFQEHGSISDGDAGIKRRLFAISMSQGTTTAYLAIRDYQFLGDNSDWCTSDGAKKGEFIVVDDQRLQKCLMPEFGGVEPVRFEIFLGQKNGYYYDFSCSKIQSDECNKIVSTFKFTSPVSVNSSAGWTTSIAEDYIISHPAVFHFSQYSPNNLVNYDEYRENDNSQISIDISRLSGETFRLDSFNQDIKNYYPHPESVPDLNDVNLGGNVVKMHNVSSLYSAVAFYYFNYPGNYSYVLSVGEDTYNKNKAVVDNIISTFEFKN